MAKQQEGVQAPDFSLNDFRGNPVRLSNFQGHRNVVVVFNRGFM